MLINVAVFMIEMVILHKYVLIIIITSFALWNCDKDVKIQLFEKFKKPSTCKTVPILLK